MRISISEACHLLNNGQVVSIPTETVYGLAATIDQPAAIDQIFSLKKRPSNNPLIIHLPSAQSVSDYALMVPEDFHALAEKFWPGPLTVVLPVDLSKVPSQVRAGLSTAAFRVPNHPLALQVLECTGPVVMPSANLSGRPSATRAQHVETDFGPHFPVVDGGHSVHGMESTIVCYIDSRWHIARLGSISAEELEDVLGYRPAVAVSAKNVAPICPGQLYRHYAPRAKLELGKNAQEHSGVVIGYEGKQYPKASQVMFLGTIDSPSSVAENLYAVLRQLDDNGIEHAYVDIDVPEDGLWATILERIQKASSK